VEVINEDLGRESAGIGDRLGSLKNALLNDQRFRLAVLGVETERSYLANYAANAMRADRCFRPAYPGRGGDGSSAPAPIAISSRWGQRESFMVG
jgi:hypothetical protein